MLFIVVPVIIGFLLGLSDEDFMIGFFSSLIGFFEGLILWLFIGGIIGCVLPTVEVVEEQEICVLNDSSTVEGANYLFSGYIDEDLVCRYVINTDRGKHIEEVNTDNVYIKEGDYKPTVKIHKYEFKKGWYYWFAHDIFTEYYVEFFVPENTVTSEYNVDLQ